MAVNVEKKGELLNTLRERLKERIYAAITMLAVVVGLAQSPHAEHWTAAAYVTGTAVGLWLATLVADVQAHRVVHKRFPGRAEVRHMLYVSSPLLSSAAGPLAMDALSAAGALDLDTALWIAAGAGIAGIAAWGFEGGRRMGGGLLASSLAAALDAVIGAGVVGVKLLAGH
ncbi:hypothetical protein OG698_41935 [Streptomyces sp. NBC_01003]|uniref:hypothetical protein n=1 Tax=Streptomyces sp. NBC_01003 TaxID=2903714 RepID=UPI003865C27D|nr:hypothetical protein OG698_41935 [Streptomyces sp. NBC_01003]